MPIDNYYSEIARVYKVLASLFIHQPNNEVLQEVEEELEIRVEDPLSDIVEDYLKLFSETEEAVLPYESLYNYPAEEGPSLWGQVTQEVNDFYQACGLSLQEYVNLPADHLSLELLFVSYLIENEMLDELTTFFEDHIIKWVPLFCDRVSEKAQTLFFKEVARALKEIVTSDYEDLLYG